MLKLWWEVLCGFCWKFTWLSLRIDKVIAMNLMYYFLGEHSVEWFGYPMVKKL